MYVAKISPPCEWVPCTPFFKPMAMVGLNAAALGATRYSVTLSVSDRDGVLTSFTENLTYDNRYEWEFVWFDTGDYETYTVVVIPDGGHPVAVSGP